MTSALVMAAVMAALISGIVRSSALTVYSTVAVATVALRVGGLLPGAGRGTAAYTFAFCVLGGVALAAAAEALWLRPEAGEAARAAPPSRAAAGDRG